MLILNYLVLLLVALSLLWFLLIDIYLFYMGIVIIKESIQNKELGGIFYKIITVMLELAAELVAVIVGYVIATTLFEIINIMMKGGAIQW